jgi:hypothetical protein
MRQIGISVHSNERGSVRKGEARRRQEERTSMMSISPPAEGEGARYQEKSNATLVRCIARRNYAGRTRPLPSCHSPECWPAGM